MKRIVEVLSDFEKFRDTDDIIGFVEYFRSLSDIEVAVMREFSSVTYKAFSAECGRRMLSRAGKES